MNLEKLLSYTSHNIKIYYPLYIHTVTSNEKWDSVKNHDISEVLIEGSYRKANDIRSKYFNKRKKQYLSSCKLLLLKDEFINEIFKCACKWKLDSLIFGYLPENKKKPVFKWYDHESLDNLINLWKCLLLFEDVKQIYNDLEQFSKNQNVSFYKEYSNNLKSNEFESDLQNLLDSFNLPHIWRESILLLLLTGCLFPPEKFCEILIKKEGPKLDIFIPIYPDTRFEDIKYHWNEIKELKDEIFGKRRIKIPDNFDDYIDIYEMKKKYDSPYRELIDFDDLDIPSGIEEEERAFEKFRKGAFRISKLIEALKVTPINIPKYITEIEKITGFKKDIYNR